MTQQFKIPPYPHKRGGYVAKKGYVYPAKGVTPPNPAQKSGMHQQTIWTGERRLPKDGEWYLINGEARIARGVRRPYPIMLLITVVSHEGEFEPIIPRDKCRL